MGTVLSNMAQPFQSVLAENNLPWNQNDKGCKQKTCLGCQTWLTFEKP